MARREGELADLRRQFDEFELGQNMAPLDGRTPEVMSREKTQTKRQADMDSLAGELREREKRLAAFEGTLVRREADLGKAGGAASAPQAEGGDAGGRPGAGG